MAAAPMGGLMMCDSSDEEIVAVFVCVAGIARRCRRAMKMTKKTHHVVCFATNIWGISLFGTRDGKKHKKRQQTNKRWQLQTQSGLTWVTGTYDVTQLTNQKASLPVLKDAVQRMQNWTSVFKNPFRINKQWEVTWHAMNTGYINSSKETSEVELS